MFKKHLEPLELLIYNINYFFIFNALLKIQIKYKLKMQITKII